jgi:ribose/xylose/arabinose/galactoside ABC-type transport system permease subunit
MAFPSRCRGGDRASIKPGQQTSLGAPMSGIYVIVAFIAVIALLNRFEFGRFD